jgi:hypothetical protein
MVPAVGFRGPATSGDANIGSTTAAEKHIVSYTPSSTVRQDGWLLQVELHLMEKPKMVLSLSLEVWRDTASHTGIMDLVYREDILDRLAAHSVARVSLTAPPQVRTGDYLGLGWTCAADPGDFLLGVGSGDISGAFSVEGPVQDREFYWASKTKSEVYVPIRGYMMAPQMVVVGDGFAGASGAVRTADTGRFDTWFAKPLSALAGGVVFQNWAAPALSASAISSQLDSAIATTHPRVAILSGGSVDLADAAPTPASQSGAAGQIGFAYASMLSSCRDWGVQPVIVLLPPRGDARAVPERMKAVDAANARLRSLAETYADTQPVIVDTAPYIGEFNGNGPEGNLWGLFKLYSTDGLTLNKAGAERVAVACADAMSVAWPSKSASPSGG